MSLILLSSKVRSSKHFFSIISLAIPLILSAYTHLWNPIGFPAIWVVEGQYMDRAMHLLEGLGLHGTNSISPHPYDHPYFGQIFLATIFKIIGYPQILKPSADLNSIETLYLVPRIIMGLLAISDTFLVYMIAHYRYENNRIIALFAATLFAIMPVTWILRKIFLESILLPFLLLSILFAVYYAKNKKNCDLTGNTIEASYKKNKKKNFYKINTLVSGQNSSSSKNCILLLFSGIFLGVSIFTKIPAFTMIPLVGYVIFTNNNSKWKNLGIWFIPVIAIPLIWPASAIAYGDFNLWLNDLGWNAHRPDIHTDSELHGVPINSLKYIFKIDPALFILGIIGIVYSQIKRDYFILLWIIPFLVFLITINFSSFFHLVPLLPGFCIAASRTIVELCSRIKRPRIKKILPVVIVSVVGCFGLISTTLLINTNVTSSFFKTYSFIVQYLVNQETTTNNQNNNNRDSNYNNLISRPFTNREAKDNDKITMLGRHATRTFFWIPRYVFDVNLDFKKIDKINDLPIPYNNSHYLIITDNHLRHSLLSNRYILSEEQYFYYYKTKPIVMSKYVTTHYDSSTYPLTSMSHNEDLKPYKIRVYHMFDVSSRIVANR